MGPELFWELFLFIRFGIFFWICCSVRFPYILELEADISTVLLQHFGVRTSNSPWYLQHFGAQFFHVGCFFATRVHFIRVSLGLF